MKVDPANHTLRFTIDADNIFLSLPDFQDTPVTTPSPTPSPVPEPVIEAAMFTRRPQPEPKAPFNWRKWDTRMGWLTGGFLLFAASQLVWWVFVAIHSGAVDRAVAR